MGFRRQSWIETGREEEFEFQGSMWVEAVPGTQGEVGVAAAEAVDEVIILRSDCTFCGVGAMRLGDGTGWRSVSGGLYILSVLAEATLCGG